MKITSLDVLFSPADFSQLPSLDLSSTICVVFDVLRATSSMVTALANGAASVVPVEDIPDALAYHAQNTGVLLAGERDGVRIEATLTGSLDFDLGNSPREFQKEKVAGSTIVMTTTNGTRALRACLRARRVLVGSFLNLAATAESLLAEAPLRLLLVCGGTYEQSAFEDALCAGALCHLVWQDCDGDGITDSALMAYKLFDQEKADLPAALSQSRNGRRLLASAQLRDDVGYCACRDSVDLVADMDCQGVVRIRQSSRVC
jgi:2-phosphosulfolactate phosphatase